MNILTKLKKGMFISSSGQLLQPTKNWEHSRIDSFKILEKELHRITSFLPKVVDNIYRLYVIENNITQDNWKCPINGCHSPRHRITRRAGYFKILCNSKGRTHLKVYKELHRKAREKACLNKTGFKTNFENPKKQFMISNTIIQKYGVNNVSNIPEVKDIKRMKRIQFNNNLTLNGAGLNIMQKKIKNINNLNKNFINSNFIDKNQHINIIKFTDYYKCSVNFVYTTLKKLDINFISKDSGFQPTNSAILYYIYDSQENMYKIGITNTNIELRFGKKFIESRKIEILMKENYKLGSEALKAEQEILEAFNYSRCVNNSWPQAKGGRTEFFDSDVLKLHKNKEKNETIKL